ncbi:hypothetical protein FRB99_000606 [Tulasnella sp. 403]|nr:hypothetical protein FRB99_000606 [Tulasnella sp. 403]
MTAPATTAKSDDITSSTTWSISSSEGASTHSEDVVEGYSSSRVGYVEPWVRDELKQAKVCKFSSFLKALLKRCAADDAGSDPSSLLRLCLEAALPLSRDEEINESLEKYLSNVSLSRLEKKKIKGMRNPSAARPLFFTNDPSPISSPHGNRSTRVPDILLLDLANARSALSVPQAENWDTVAKVAGNTAAKRTPPEWRHILLAAEFKKHRDHLSFERISDDYRIQDEPPLVPAPVTTDDGPIHPGSAPVTPSSPAAMRYSPEAEGPQCPSPSEQTAMYALEMFLPHRSHIINMTVIGRELFLWWYDREGIICSTGLDFVKDLPWYIVLLITFQRLDNQGWGILPLITQPCQIIPRVNPPGDLLFVLGNVRRSVYCLRGQGNAIYDVTPVAPDTRQFVAKLGWPATSRTSEVQMYEEIRKEVDKLDKDDMDRIDIEGHVADLVAYRRMPEYETRFIRDDVGISSTCNRQLTIAIFPKLRPIHTITDGDQLIRVLWDVIRNRALWRHGICHRDISDGNIMVFWDNGTPIGVLIDFDLATLIASDNTGSVNWERAGTLPFMALELLAASARQDAGVIHRFAHDLESTFWVFA